MKEGIFLPSKFADYVSRGKPVLCLSPKVGVINDLVSEYGGGVVVESTNKDQILDALKLIIDPKIFYNIKGKRGQRPFFLIRGSDLLRLTKR